jgi:hypothetical protein
MGFRDALNRVLGQPADASQGAAYDRSHWRKKLARVLDQLPDSEPEWEPLLAESRSLGFDPGWVKGCQREEFALMIRRAVADGMLTGMEHRKLDLARDLIGLSDSEAEATLHSIIAEAQSFFGKPIQDV